MAPGQPSLVTDPETTESALEALVRAAVRAPSSHNTQPWRFRTAPATIDVFADPSRALPLNDPDGRELVISCGCAVLNLRAAAARAGLAAAVDTFPDPGRPEWLARLRLKSGPSPAELARLAEQIDRRHTHRGRFAAAEVPPAVLDRLRDGVAREGAAVRVVADEGLRRLVAQLVERGDAAQWAEPAWRRELAAWMHPRGRGDGLSLPGPLVPLARLVVRWLDLGRRVGAADRARALAVPVLAVLETEGDAPVDWLAAGQALQHLLLLGAEAGLQACYLNQPLQVAALRPALRTRLGGGWPQVVLGLGRPRKPAAPAPRRPIAEVLRSSGAPGDGDW